MSVVHKVSVKSGVHDLSYACVRVHLCILSMSKIV